MDYLIIGALMIGGGLMAAFGLLDSDRDDEGEAPETDPATATHGTAGEDLLVAAGNDTVSGWGGNDTITLHQDATGHGNRGDDTLTLYGHAEGHGDAGDDTLHAHGDARAHGGEGRDSLFLYSDAEGYGGAGDDRLEVSDEAEGHGGDGDDFLILRGDAEGYGGAGDDTLRGAQRAEMHGGEGADLFLADFVPGQVLTIGDYAPGDRLGVILREADPSRLGLSVTAAPDGAHTDVALRYGNETTTLRLDGVTDFDPAAFAIYPDVGHLDPAQGLSLLDGTEGADTLLAGLDGPPALILGRGGDDVLQGPGPIHGGHGGDTITGRDDLFGGQGDDAIAVIATGRAAGSIGQVEGGGGDDSIVAQDQTAGFNGAFYGGAGDDLLVGYGDAYLNGGPGDDTIIHLRGELTGSAGAIATGAGADLVVLDARAGGEWDYDTARAYPATLITDFTPGQDSLGVILPPGDAGAVRIEIANHPALGYTDIYLYEQGVIDRGNGVTEPIPRQAFRLLGVTAFTAADIAFFDSLEAAEAAA
ncbi:hypothetical protein [Ruixingdingia sedimenti]|uniref:Hemolysin-type calcium-binding repeat-containing protein n=1 Tax=Ruixingdingia sedimenti TaxID=3073604 RepID=A0ABU1FCJ5_9RHOB|nr:hypothetical protein [Xinfangfangia sp. LG-4]MDR5654616.1 hypothetical protein [Xinfangfangia sp. LG-4]